MIAKYIPTSLLRSVPTEQEWDAVDCDSVLDVCQWAGDYASDAGQHAHLRYTIGVYQLDSWRRAFGKSPRETAEAAGAFVIHAVGAAKLIEPAWSTEAYWCHHAGWKRPYRWSALPLTDRVDDRRLLDLITACQRQYCYVLTCKPGTIRYNRIDRLSVQSMTMEACVAVMSTVDPALRASGLEVAMQMLLDVEWRK